MADTGHARNVGNFEILVSRVTALGVPYNPVNTAIKLVALNTKLTAAQGTLDDLSLAVADEKIEVNNRQEVFDGVRKLTTRVVNSFEAGGASSKDLDDAKGFKRKLDGARAKTIDDPVVTPTPVPDPPVEDPLPGDDTPPKHVSASQTSYVQLVEHFTGLIDLLTKSGGYSPNETDLKLLALNAKKTAMESANTVVIAKLTATANARLARDNELYTDETGLYDLAALVKKYVKSVFGADAPEYKQISGLEFTLPRKY